jgi:hypothetical protein
MILGMLQQIFYIKLNKSFETGQSNHYFELVDMIDFDFYIYIYVLWGKWHLVKFDFNDLSFYVCFKIKN